MSPLRLIVSACGDPLDKTNLVFLRGSFTQLLPFIPAHLKNTEQYLSAMKDKFPCSLPPGHHHLHHGRPKTYMETYPPTKLSQPCVDMIEAHKDKIDLFGLTLDSLKTLLQHCLQNNYLRFGDNFFKQTKGIAMGSRVAPPLAITFMHVIESLILSSPGNQPVLYLRYIDDILGVWTHGASELNNYHKFVDSFHPSLKFSLERTDPSQISSVPFFGHPYHSITVRTVQH